MTTAASVHRDLDVARLLTLVERSVVQRLGAALKEDNASIEEWRVLSLLGDGNGHAMIEIAEFAMLPPPTLTKIIDRMVSLTLVHRRVDEADRRRVLVFATDRGRQALEKWTATVERQYNDIVTAIGGEELALLRVLLTRMSARLSQ
ncbi:MarR family winged helix-turn-helix transcriptional regulator [Nonomuraea basaltis]|uniref:MarR family winged helix-turn-helix transcriptional regulator n=1 Tax=Nonomuraea basaltis TaxID=2495887 RepID=UPI00110C63C3|nr:MarR family transcriptional regulator [Nonomuraea basaltis]TMR97187.1 MarR family transcriptional regulator [Nonomuraea basaltis]